MRVRDTAIGLDGSMEEVFSEGMPGETATKQLLQERAGDLRVELRKAAHTVVWSDAEGSGVGKGRVAADVIDGTTSEVGVRHGEQGNESATAGARSPRARLARSLSDWMRSILIAVVLFFVIRTAVVEAFKIPTSSMEGTLLVGDFLLVNKAVYGARLPLTDLRLPPLAEPKRGEVVVFHPPHEPEKNYVKRVVGVAADTLAMHDKVLYRNGSAVNEPYVQYVDDGGDAVHPDMEWQANHLIASQRNRYHPTRDNWGPIVVPHGHYFVLGDNRDNSEDSRYWGFVARDQVRGRPWFVYYSYHAPRSETEPWRSRVRWARLGTVIR